MGNYYAPDDVVEYWDARHREWDETTTPEYRKALFQGKHDWFNLRFGHILPIPEKRQGFVLDYGCGCGMYSVPLLERFIGYIGVDTSQRAIEIAKTQFGGYVADFFLLPNWEFDDSDFDCVVSITVLQHLPLEEKRKAIEFIKRVLKPTGIYVGLEFIGATAAYDMPQMPVEQWKEAWLPWVVTEDDPPDPAWKKDNVYIARLPR